MPEAQEFQKLLLPSFSRGPVPETDFFPVGHGLIAGLDGLAPHAPERNRFPMVIFAADEFFGNHVGEFQVVGVVVVIEDDIDGKYAARHWPGLIGNTLSVFRKKHARAVLLSSQSDLAFAVGQVHPVVVVSVLKVRRRVQLYELAGRFAQVLHEPAKVMLSYFDHGIRAAGAALGAPDGEEFLNVICLFNGYASLKS